MPQELRRARAFTLRPGAEVQAQGSGLAIQASEQNPARRPRWGRAGPAKVGQYPAPVSRRAWRAALITGMIGYCRRLRWFPGNCRMRPEWPKVPE